MQVVWGVRRWVVLVIWSGVGGSDGGDGDDAT